jgi:hypothetical protein
MVTLFHVIIPTPNMSVQDFYSFTARFPIEEQSFENIKEQKLITNL